MFCTKCGNQIGPGMKFCTKCGSAVKQKGTLKESVGQQQNNTGNQYPLGRQNNTSYQNPLGYQNNMGYQNSPDFPYGQGGQPAQKKGSKGILIAIICICLVLAGGGVGAYFLFFSDHNAKDTETVADNSIQATQMDKPDETLEPVVEESAAPQVTSTPTPTPPPVVQVQAQMDIHQVDNTNFPSVGLYVSAVDEYGEGLAGLSAKDFDVHELDASGNMTKVDIESVYQVMQGDHAALSLVLDMSGSMDGQRITDAKNAADAFLSSMDLAGGDKVSIISFNDYVYLGADFCSDYSTLSSAVYGLQTSGTTAMYDGLYAGIYQAYYQQGAKCVIAFTDGQSNTGVYTRDDVVGLSQGTGIPVYLIGIGSGCDGNDLQNLADECSGEYFYLDYSDISTILNQIYSDIYQKQRESYVIRYKSSNQKNKSQFRNIEVSFSSESQYVGVPVTREYLPVVDVNAQYGDAYKTKDYIIDDSDYNYVTDSDLRGLTPAELRIARNEIFARHGRLFQDELLNKWFFSKNWYLNISNKQSPENFSYSLSQVELENVDRISAYEQDYLANYEIFPDIEYTLLAEYDVCLHYNSLKRALSQAVKHRYTDTCVANIKLIKKAMKGAYRN